MAAYPRATWNKENNYNLRLNSRLLRLRSPLQGMDILVQISPWYQWMRVRWNWMRRFWFIVWLEMKRRSQRCISWAENSNEWFVRQWDIRLPLTSSLAWLQQMRADTAPFIGYLQSVAHVPSITHVKMASNIRHCVRRVKSGLRYLKLTPPLMMVTVADSA